MPIAKKKFDNLCAPSEEMQSDREKIARVEKGQAEDALSEP
jgi:hypothetical protein